MKYSHQNISPLDSRYASKISNIRDNFNEGNLIKVRFEIEIDWLIFICTKYPKLFVSMNRININKLLKFKKSFNDQSIKRIKKIEKTTNHDVKAVEYFIRDHFKKDKQLQKFIHLIHFGLTSEDINSLSYAILIRDGKKAYITELVKLNKSIQKCASKWSNISFLSRTHGQPASPSTIGKEFKVFKKRLDSEIQILKSINEMAKFSGATGNFHTLELVDNKTNWINATKKFINQYKINQNPYTTQIESHDWISQISHSFVRINNILTDLSQDMWIYISNDIFSLKMINDEVGSSTMPHKVNPIDFENAEGNLGLSNALFNFFANKLSKSRLQRDLSDSTVLRNIGLAFGYASLAIFSTQKGLSKIIPNKKIITEELDNNWEVLTEAIQTIMRLEGISDAYEQIKKLSRGASINKDDYINFVTKLNISKTSKQKLLNLTPHSYVGLSSYLSKN